MKNILLRFKKIWIPLIAVMLINTSVSSATFTAVTSGNWSSITTWGGVAPSFTNTVDNITIPTGITVTLDNNLTLNGPTASLDVAGILSSTQVTELIISQGNLTGNGNINIGVFMLQPLSNFNFTGNIVATLFTNSKLNLQTAANITVQETLTLLSGTISIESDGVIVMATNSEIVMAGGSFAINGGLLELVNIYDVSYTTTTNTTAGVELSGTGLRNLTVDLALNTNTLTLVSDLTVSGILSLSRGSLVLALNDLFITGEVATNGIGSITSTVASDISINSSTGITGSLNFNGASAVNNFTVNVGPANHAQIKGTLAVNGFLTLSTGTLRLDTANLILRGNIAATGTGTISPSISSVLDINTLNTPNGAIRFNSATTIKTLKVNIDANGGSVRIDSDLFIEDSLTLTKGSLDIGNHLVLLSTDAVIASADSNSYVITGDNGRLGAYVTAGSFLPTNFPVGTATEYFPATVTLNAGSTSGVFYIGVIENVYSLGTTGNDLSATNHVVDATWMVSSDVPSNINMNLNVMWTSAAEVNGFSRNSCYVSHYMNNQWDVSTAGIALIGTNGLYGMSRNNITSLSPFTVFDNITLGINETVNNNNISIYPNPATDVIYVSNTSDNTDAVNVDILNISGQIISRYVLTDATSKISLSELNSGSYFVKLSNDKINIVKKIIKL